jgi:hypothetical protein
MAASALVACSGDFGPPVPISDASVGDARARGDHDEAGAENPINPHANSAKDASSEPFFINDPAPPMCGPDGGMSDPAPVGGTSECPGDKNREGCSCPEVGKQVACWPGRRENRSHGICKDGVTTCQANIEFIQAWGPCVGYVLPKDGATQGADACRCFSNGQWALSNLVPCINNDGPYIYSSHPDPDHGFACDAVSITPPPAPSAPWTKSTLNIECAGQYQLCYAIKAGKASDPKPADCTVIRTCIDVWYEHAGKTQNLPDLPGWAASDQACAKRFVDSGGYGEMSVKGKSAECDAVDDGKGAAFVFRRTSYCPSDCGERPDADGCKDCSVMGSGSF